MPRSALLRSAAGLLAAASVAVFAAACGESGGDPSADPAAIVPARAPVYVEANLKPGDDVEAVAKKLSGEEDPGGAIKRFIEKEAREDDKDFKYADDIEPWLGERAAFFAPTIRAGDDSPVGLVVPTKDSDKAKEFLEGTLRRGDGEGDKPQVVERSHRGTKYLVDTTDDEGVAIVDDYAVFGSDAAIKGALDAREGESLAESSEYEKARGSVEDDGAGFVYVRLSTLFSGLGSQGAALRQALQGLGETIGMGIDADADSIRVETRALGLSGEGGPAVGPGKVFAQLPAESWAAIGTPDLGGQIQRAIEQFTQLGALGGQDPEQLLDQLEAQLGIDPRRDLAAWMGDAGFFVTGDKPAEIGGGLIAQSKDPEATARSIPRLSRFLVQVADMRARPLKRDGVETGVTLTAPQLPLPIHMALTDDDQFVVAVTDRALEDSLGGGSRIGDAQEFKDASGKLGDGLEPMLFMNFAPIKSLVDSSGQGSNKNVAKLSEALDRLTTLIAGAKRDGDTSSGRIVVGVK